MNEVGSVTRRDLIRTGGTAVLTAAVAGCGPFTTDPATQPAATDAPPRVAAEEDVVVAAAGDIACPPQVPPHQNGCGQERTAALISSLQPHAVLALGDLQYEHGTLSNFLASYDRSWGRFKDITRPVPGNHDFSPAGATGYYDYFGAAAGEPGRGYYSFDLGAWHLIALNSEPDFVDGGSGPDSPQDRWLRADLEANRGRPMLVFVHNPLFSSGPRGPSPHVRTFWQRLYTAGVELVLSGNDHNYQRFAPQDPDGRHDPERGITQFVVGTGGMNLNRVVRPEPNSVAHYDMSFGVLELVLRPDEYSWSFHSVDGGPPIDTGSTPCRAT